LSKGVRGTPHGLGDLGVVPGPHERGEAVLELPNYDGVLAARCTGDRHCTELRVCRVLAFTRLEPKSRDERAEQRLRGESAVSGEHANGTTHPAEG
jgi:hypothetical protein